MAYPQQSSTVVVAQPVMQAVTVSVRPWSSGMCACFDDCGTCKQFIIITILYIGTIDNTRKYINVLSG